MRNGTDSKTQALGTLLSLLVLVFGLGAGNAAAQMAGMASDHLHAGVTPGGKTVDIVRDPTDVPPAVGTRGPAVVKVELTAKEVAGRLDPASGTTYRYWTFNGKVPAPMIRVRQGDTVEVTLHNDPSSHMVHSVDFHAALGPGGGAALSQTVPGQSKTFTFQATTPGLFVYHCGTPMVAEHVANGMYGLMLVEPAGGLPHVDHEYYIMQSEIYTAAPKGKAGLQQFSDAKLMEEDPEYFVFNGAVDALTKQHPLHAKVGDTVRIFFGDAGPNKPSSLHILGEIFAQEYEAGSLTSPPLSDVQTALVAPGSAAMLQLQAAESGEFTMMDHAMARMAKGLSATLEVSGAQNAALMHAGSASQEATATVAAMTQADLAAGASEADLRPASSAGTAPVETASTSAASGEFPATHHRTTGRAKSMQQPGLVPASISLSKAPTAQTELNGCLSLQPDGKAMLKLLDSQKIYRLEARPLLFAENANRFVHVTGHPGSVVAEEVANFPSFVVDTVDELAPTCSTKISPAALRAASVKSSSAGVGPAITVGMTDMAFAPAKIVIKAGQKVVWKNSSQVIHDVVDDANKAMSKADVQRPAGVQSFASAFLQPGQTFSQVFTKPGTYRYVCTLHEGSGMKGTIIVR